MRPAPAYVTPTVASRAFLIGAVVAVLAVNGWAQKASNWRVYKLADGLPESGCISVSFSPQRKVLARHLSLPFVTILDGYTNAVFPAPEPGKSRVYQSPGGQLWTATPERLLEFRQNSWVSHPLLGLAAGREAGAKVIDPVPLQPIRQGLVVFLQPDGLMEFNGENPDRPQTRLLKAASESAIGRFYGMASARDGGLWITGARGLARVPGPLRALKPETEWREYLLPDNLGIENLQVPQEERLKQPQPDASFFVTALGETRTNDAKVVVCFDGRRWEILKSGDYKVRQAWRGPEKVSWGMAIDSVFQWRGERANPREVEDIPVRQFFDVAVEVGGAFWLATSEGLFRYAQLLWSCPEPVRDMTLPVRCLATDTEGRLWFCTSSRLHCLAAGKLSEYPIPASANRLQPRKLFVLGNEGIVLTMEDPEIPGIDQIYRFDPQSGSLVRVENGPQKLRVLGTLKTGSLCIRNLAANSPGSELELYDGQEFSRAEEMLKAPSVGKINVVYPAENGEIWLGGDAGVASLQEETWRPVNAADRMAPEQATFFVELPDGKLWSAAQDQVWEFDGRNWSLVRRGFDGINGLLRTRDGSIWVASNSGVHRFFRGAWVEHGMEEGLPAASVRDLRENAQGLWLATTRGLTLFHPEADPETDAPRTWVTKVSGENQSGGEGGPIVVNFTGRDKWKHTLTERLLYSYRLDEREWSPFEETDHVPFTDLGSGKHYFQVRAMDRNSNIDPKPAQLEFSIVLPWYQETRLVLIALLGAAAAVFFGVLAFNKHLQLLRSYAEVEQKVAERTKQLEVANRELLQSQKMTALGTLAAGIAHDFNNILSIIKGSAQIIEDNLDNPAKIQTRANRIKTVVEQGAGIVKAMLGFSRESGPLPELCVINSVVEDTLRLLGDRFLREVQVKFEPAPDLPPVATARDFIQQILLNFIFNAAEAMATRKEIIVSSRAIKGLPQELVLAPSPAAEHVALCVQDFGCGIPPENLMRIFEPFFTTKAMSARRGTGLGLSMVYELAKKLGAGLAVHSVVNQGSTFMLILPIQPLPADTASIPASASRSETALPI